MRIAVYAIAHNESQFVRRFCESVGPHADALVVADTGSTDDTVALLREYTPHVHQIGVRPWRFDLARNAALALVPPDIDVCISIDLDEILVPDWRPLLESVWSTHTTRLRYLYDWGQGVRFYADKIHARWGYRWHHPCHEVLRIDGRVQEAYADLHTLMVQHLPDETKSRGQYLDLLRLSVIEDPTCPRNAFYYARELTYYRHHREAIVALQRYLDLPTATWTDERAYAMRLVGEQYDLLGDHQQALVWYVRSLSVAPRSRDGWCALAASHYHAKEWADALRAAEEAIAITERQWLYFENAAAWGAFPHDIAAVAAWQLGLRESARRHGENALALDPDNPRLQGNMAWYQTDHLVEASNGA